MDKGLTKPFFYSVSFLALFPLRLNKLEWIQCGGFSWACLLPRELLQEMPLWDVKFESPGGSCTCAFYLFAPELSPGGKGREKAGRLRDPCLGTCANCMPPIWPPIEEGTCGHCAGGCVSPVYPLESQRVAPASRMSLNVPWCLRRPLVGLSPYI